MEKRVTSRQLRAEETKEKIIRAAKALIAAKGFENTSIGDIADRAGVSTGSFYTYFKRKEDVILELSQTDFYRLAEIVNGMQDKGLLERLRYYCGCFLGDIEQTGIEICRQWLKNNLTAVNMPIADERITKYKYDYRAMQEVLNEAVRRGELNRDAPIDELALLINAQLYGLMIIWCMTDGEVRGSEKTDVMCDTVLNAALEPYRK